MLAFKQKLIAGSVLFVMTLAVWVFALMAGGLFGVTLAAMITAFTGGIGLRVLTM